MRVWEYVLVNEVGLSLEEVRDMPRSEVMEWIHVHKEAEAYEEEIRERKRKREQRKNG